MEPETYDFEYQAPLRIGASVPDIEFEIYHKESPTAGDLQKTVKLSDYKGKWLVLFFYPADFTFICPTELEEMAALYPQFQKEGAEVISVSADTVYTHKAWHDTSEAIKKINYPMAADPAAKLSRTFGTYIEPAGLEFIEDEGLALRGSFLIDPEGILRTIEIHSNNIGRSGKELLRTLRAAKFVREHKGQVCPASWEEGGDTLEPGLGLVGKI